MVENKKKKIEKKSNVFNFYISPFLDSNVHRCCGRQRTTII